MVGTAPKYPFFYSFLAGVLAVAFVGALTFGSIYTWRYLRDRRNKRRDPARNSNAIPLTLTLLEDGLKASGGASDLSSSRSPSRLGGISPSSSSSLPVKRADEGLETDQSQSQFLAQPAGTADHVDGQQRPFSGVSQSSANYIVNPLTTEGVERAEDHTKRAKVSRNLTTWSNEGNTTTERVRPQPSDYPSRPRIPPIPPTPTTRMSVSTVWSQESMWSREKRPDVPLPPLPSMPAFAHMPAPRRVVFSPIVAAGSQNRRSTSSLPRSVGQSDYEDYI